MARLSVNGEMREIDQRRRARSQHDPRDHWRTMPRRDRVMSFRQQDRHRDPEDWTAVEGWLAVAVVCMLGLTSAFTIAVASLGI